MSSSYEFSENSKVANLDMFHKLMKYKHKMGVGDKYWDKTADNLEDILKKLSPNKKNGYIDELPDEIQGKIITLLKNIENRFERLNQKIKYGKVFNPILKKENRIRELMKNIMKLLKEGGWNKSRQELFNTEKTKKLLLNKGLQEVYKKAININRKSEKNEIIEETKLKFFKENIEKLNDCFKELTSSNFVDFENLKKSDDTLDNFCVNLQKANNDVKDKLLNKINLPNYNEDKLFKIYKFIVEYNNFIKLVNCSINEISNNNLREKLGKTTPTPASSTASSPAIPSTTATNPAPAPATATARTPTTPAIPSTTATNPAPATVPCSEKKKKKIKTIIVPDSRQEATPSRVLSASKWRQVLTEYKNLLDTNKKYRHDYFQKIYYNKLDELGNCIKIFENFCTFRNWYCPYSRKNTPNLSDTSPGGFYTPIRLANDDGINLKFKVSKSELFDNDILIDEIRNMCKDIFLQTRKMTESTFDARKEIKNNNKIIDLYKKMEKLNNNINQEIENILNFDKIIITKVQASAPAPVKGNKE